MAIKKWGNRLVDIDYISKKFGPVEMDVTTVEREPLHKTSNYLKERKEKKQLKELENKKQVINNRNNGEECIK